MAGYVKRIALIKTLRQGFSADGGKLGGIVRCEAYAGYFRAETALINFAPLAEGCWRVGITDGNAAAVFDPPVYECEKPFDISSGFACIVAFCRGGEAVPVAYATCGEGEGMLALVARAITDNEKPPAPSYDDDAIAEDNYYGTQTDEDNKGDLPGGQDEGQRAAENEDDAGAGKGEEGAAFGGDAADGQGEKDYVKRAEAQPDTGDRKDGGDAPAADFYERMSDDVKNIFSTYPGLGALECAVEGSRWAKITYGSGAHYAFGVIYSGANAKYLCYGVPVEEGAPCPESLKGRAEYVPVEGGGYWVMYQDAATGISLKRE